MRREMGVPPAGTGPGKGGAGFLPSGQPCSENAKGENTHISIVATFMKIQIHQVRRIFSDGKHNAFTGLCRFRGGIYLAFRSGETHLTWDGAIVVLRSTDEGENFEKVAELRADGDLRDPCLLASGERLYVYAGERQNRGGASFATSVVFVSANGRDFARRDVLGLKPKTFLWAVLERSGDFTGTGYSASNGKYRATLYRSTDGIHWRRRLDFAPEANETAIAFGEDGTLYGLLRQESPPQHPVPFRLAPGGAAPEYGEFPLPLQGIMLRRYRCGSFIVGRRWDGNRENLRVEMFYLPDGRPPVSLGGLPSGGDCSYASMTPLANGDSLIAYYSMHAYAEQFKGSPDPEHTLPADVYLARVAITESPECASTGRPADPRG